MDKAHSALKRILCLAVVTLFWGCSPKEDGPRPGDYFKTHWQDESQFIVEEVITDFAEMAYYGHNHKLPERGQLSVEAVETPASVFRAPVYDVVIKLDKQVFRVSVNVDQPIWSAATYDDVAKTLFDSLGIARVDALGDIGQDTDLLTSLLDGTADTIQQKDRQLSESLGQDFLNPQLHEQAAVLIGAFSLRDNAGEFYDIRLPLCRMTAHLLFARALTGQGDYGINGKLADAQLFTLMNNEAGALDRINAFTQPALAAWGRALHTRNTRDYRDLQKISPRSRLENIELFRAYGISVDKERAWDELDEKERAAVPDYCRIMNAGWFSVGMGHVLGELAMPLEMHELGDMYKAYEGKTLDQNNAVEALNERPGRCLTKDKAGKVKVEVLGWGQWSFFCQRHLCEAMRRNFYFLNNMLGVPQDAAAYSAQYDQSFSGIYLYPFVRRFNCTDEASYHKALDDAYPLTVATPHLIPPMIWNYLDNKPKFAALYAPYPNPHINEWHKHNPPPGTVYNLEPRLYHPSLTQRGDSVAVFEDLLKLAPYDGQVADFLVQLKFGNRKLSYDEVEPLYRHGLEYNVHYMQAVAATLQDKPDQYEALMLKVAGFIPCAYLDLGNYFVGLGFEDRGAEYLAKAMDQCQDAVRTSNRAGWLIRYYQKKGESAKAYKLADFAADQVYSYAGLEAKAELLESDKRYTEALDYYKKIEERYNDQHIVIAFCLRYKTATGARDLDGNLQERFKLLFPKGIEKATGAADFHGPPADGVLIDGQNEELTKAGLNQGDIIVSLFGMRVHTMDQYAYARESTGNPLMKLVVWKNGQYVDVQASPPDHLFGVMFRTYPVR